MGALAYRIYKRQRWAYLAEAAVCFTALAGRAWQILMMPGPNALQYRALANTWFLALYFAGVIPAILFGLYSYRQASIRRHPSARLRHLSLRRQRTLVRAGQSPRASRPSSLESATS
jgi:hypothetical protein